MDELMIQRCPVGCQVPLEETEIVLPEGPLRRCPECRQLVSSCRRSRYEETMRSFDHDEGTMPEGRAARRHRKRIGAILEEAVDFLDMDELGISFLDVGCSSGSVLKIAESLGFGDVRGVEPAARAARAARNLGFEVYTGYLHEAEFVDGSFDMISTFEVIEHLPDATAMAAEVFRVLRPGGLWLIGTGNAESWTAQRLKERWEYFSIARNGGHISFFNPHSIRLLAERNEFGVAYLRTKRVLFTPPEERGLLGKLRDELLAWPARLFGRGHDMLAALRKPL